MREGDTALLALAEIGHEEQIFGGPGSAFGRTGRGPLPERHATEDSAERHHRQALGLELDKEDAPGLTRYERAQALDLLDLGRVLRVDSKFLGGVLEGHLLEVLRGDRPVEFVAQVGDELVKAADAGEA